MAFFWLQTFTPPDPPSVDEDMDELLFIGVGFVSDAYKISANTYIYNPPAPPSPIILDSQDEDGADRLGTIIASVVSLLMLLIL
jgi:hypothetical protein